MPELPDLTIYKEALEARVVGATLERVRLASPFLLRTATPPLASAHGQRVLGIERIGKRLVLVFEGELFLAMHLMIAGRLRWSETPGAVIPGRIGLAAFDFSSGTLVFTEASSRRRAALFLFDNRTDLHGLDAGGIEPLGLPLPAFAEALRRENHTLKRSLTDPKILAGIGNAYSDEILHAAKLSPTALSQKVTDEAMARLHEATQSTLTLWIDRLRSQTGDTFPTKVTAFRPEMAVHGRFGEPCPVCGSKVQRIVSGETESNYCATCQTGGRLLADRSLSRLLRADWPKTLTELEERKRST